MNRLIIAGSPRIDGRSARLANLLFEACIDECPEDELAFVPVSEVNVSGCTGCGACMRLACGEKLEGDEPEDEQENPSQQKSKQAAQFDHPRRCVIDDDMSDIYELIDEAEELTIVSPVYFSGPPSQLKALLDRLQPYYAATATERAAAKAEGRSFKTAVKPAVLHVVGDGSDPHGFAALVSIVTSALAVAGYKLETVLDWVGKIDKDGEILEEADVIDLLVDDDEFVVADVEVVFGETEEADNERWSGIVEEEDDPEDDYRPRLRLNDEQVKERGRTSSEAGRSGGARGRTDKRSGKGGSQTNNRNPRKENQAKAKKRRENNAAGVSKKNTGKPQQGGRKGGRRG